MKRLLFSLLVILSLTTEAQTIDISGTWHATLMQDGSQHDVKLPGSLLTNNLGETPSVETLWTGSIYDSSFYFNPYMDKYRKEGHLKLPFFLTPNRHYVNTVVYNRKVFVPSSWQGKHVTLFLERPHIETTVTVNGQEVGHQMSLSTPHIYEVGSFLIPGQENDITIAVYNGIENVGVGQDSHSVTDQTQGNWNGIVGRIELQCHGRYPVRQAKITYDLHHLQIFARVKTEAPHLTFYLDGKEVSADHDDWDSSLYVLPIPEIKYWTAFHPDVYHLAIASADDTLQTTFGLRYVETEESQIYLVQHPYMQWRLPIWLRGTVENCDFPLTGYPPTDVESWKRIFTKCKQWGLNAMRFHSYCPPEAAFTAADEVGFYLQPEGPSWPNHGVRIGRGMPIDQYLIEETQRIVDAYGNHPSFIMFSAGNEPAGDWVPWGNQWVKNIKSYDSGRRIYCSFNVGGGWAWDSGSDYHVKGGARGLDWDRNAPQSQDNYDDQLRYPSNYRDTVPNDEPIIAHEQGQWCAFPDLTERSQYTGVYKAYNFDIFADLLRKNGMEDMADKFLYASGRLQTLCYKYEIERNLRTKDYAGFMLLGLNDYSGQGTALVGPLNVFWREKGYVKSDEWRQFCNDVVVMAEFPKFVFTSGDTCSVPIDIYNSSILELRKATLSYSITPSGLSQPVKSLSIPMGKSLHVARVPLFTATDKPAKYTLRLTLQGADSTFTNTYDYWVYPDERVAEVPSDIYFTDTLDQRAISVLRKGGKVLIAGAGKVRYGSDVKQSYLPVFWNTSWFKMRPPHTTGAYIDARHPLFNEFPTDDWGNLNWWELLNHAYVMNLSEFPRSYQPPIQPIDTWHVSRKLGMLIEANVLKGKLLMTTMDIRGHLNRRPVARQMRRAIIDYMMSDDFRPAINVSPQVISHLFTREAPAVNMFTKDSPDELKPKLK